ncbi:hypothetical protein Poli38472_012395 [Pythium oligandrum]|uniref:Uncharacterized protein n=1 Tax=Pythium oligandrum TaxID=41045 RepID=A0A8K1CQA8_PYTOL|nr:hypothetical protein Poli38472_012395 [Pythium oligandrum]|eukprot:TMW67279.1 hypothetical protein Poli38472_012395 [Pythium oligandrum]
MDPMSLFDMERRTGISHNDVDDFVSRMDMISSAIEQIKDGTFDPLQCNIPGYKTPEQEEQERQERERKEEERKRKEAERKQKLKEEERENWWRKARLHFAVDEDEEEETTTKRSTFQRATAWANRVLTAYKARDANDYSVWDSWVPEDPASMEEKAAREAALEKLRNQEFEKNNPEFCQQFQQDLEKRQRSQRTKERDADKSKQLGNRCYKRREYDMAIKHYMQALEHAPFNVAVLANLAQTYLRIEALEDSVEFSTRALYVEPMHVKALSRRATVWHRQKKWKEAAEDMEKALELAPENTDVIEQHSIIVGDYEDSLVQQELDSRMRSSDPRDSASRETKEELMFMQEVLKKMDEQTQTDDFTVLNAAWVGYELLIPFLERNVDVRTLFRTSGGLETLAERLTGVLTAVSTLFQTEDERSDVLTARAMLHCLAAVLTASSRNQVVLFRMTTFKSALLSALEALATLPLMLQEQMLRVWEEAIDSKSWKSTLITSPLGIQTLLNIVRGKHNHPDHFELGDSATTHRAMTLTASSVLFTISSDDNGRKALVEKVDVTLQATITALRHHSKKHDRPIQSNVLGLLTNLSTNEGVRLRLASPSDLGTTLVERLIRAFTPRRGHSAVPRAWIESAERALAALLNLSFGADSYIRRVLVDHNTLPVLTSVFGLVSRNAWSDIELVSSRALSLLCRLHSLPVTDVSTKEALVDALTTTELLTQLHKLCERSLSRGSSSNNDTDDDENDNVMWQTQAQIWCHVGWALDQRPQSVSAYLRDDTRTIPVILETLGRLNALAPRCYERTNQQTPRACERVAGNIVKVLIALLRVQTDVAHARTFWAKTTRLKAIIGALQTLPDGTARKNVAILLARLCQLGQVVKDRVRELRGIEMLLTVSRSLSLGKPAVSEAEQRHALAF